MNCFIPDKPVVQLYWDRKTDTFRARTNIHPDLKVDITVESADPTLDHALYQGLPFEVEVN